MSKCANESGTGLSKIAKMDAMAFDKWERKLLDAMVGPIRDYVSNFDEKGKRCSKPLYKPGYWPTSERMMSERTAQVWEASRRSIPWV
jgi:hypothetical protein